MNEQEDPQGVIALLHAEAARYKTQRDALRMVVKQAWLRIHGDYCSPEDIRDADEMLEKALIAVNEDIDQENCPACYGSGKQFEPDLAGLRLGYTRDVKTDKPCRLCHGTGQRSRI